MKIGRHLGIGVAATILHAAAPAPASVPPPPRAVVQGNALVLAALPDVFAHAEIRPHLDSGLTASLVLAVTARGSGREALRSGLRVDLRLDLWERHFQVSTSPAAGAPAIATHQELASWWRDLRLPLETSARLPAASVRRVEVELVLIPFSQLEERDARRWLGEAAGAHRGAGDLAGGGEAASPVAAAIHALVAGSIRRQPLLSWRWVLVPQGGAP